MSRRATAQDRASSSVEVFEIACNIPSVVRFLGPIEGLLTHWHSGRSHPCPGANECPPTVHRAKTVWRGYAPAERWDERARAWFPGVQSVTEALEEVMRGRVMRGEVWCLTRSQEGRKPGPATGVFCERHGEEILPPAFDMLPVLLRFYHATSLVLGVSNPLPAKLVLPATAGPAPKLPAGLVPEQTERATPEQLAEFREQLRSAMGGRRPAKHENNGHAESNGHASK